MHAPRARSTRQPVWPSLLLAALLSACGGGNQDPILGGLAVRNGGPAYATPTVTSVLPAPNASAVATNTRQASATFSQPMTAATLTSAFTVACTTGAPIVGVVSLVAATRTAVFTLDPGSSLPPNSQCVARIDASASSATAQPLAADFSWRWTTASTPDVTPPTVVGTIHANGSVGVPTNTKVGATFSEAMNSPSVSAANFLLRQTLSGVAVAGSLALSGKNLVFSPAAALLAGTQYSATIRGGAPGVADVAGNHMAVDYAWGWTTAGTADVTAPTVGTTNPVDLGTNVCTNKTINATFSEAMDPQTVNNSSFTLAKADGTAVGGLVRYAAATRIASLDPGINLVGTPPTQYIATIHGGSSGVLDLAGNAMASDRVLHFTTSAATCAAPPVLGAAVPFGAFNGSASTAVTNNGLNTLVNGDVGAKAAPSQVTGVHDAGGLAYSTTSDHDGTVNGTVYTVGAPATGAATVAQVYSDALAAFNSLSPTQRAGGVDVANLAQCPSCGGTALGAGQLGGRTLPPGIYRSATGSYAIGATLASADSLTLDAGGDANAVWIFQTAEVSGNLTVGVTGPAAPAVPVQVLLINGATANNVFWYVPAGASIGTGSTMVGTLLADGAISVSSAGGSPPTAVLTWLLGRAIALSAGVTITNTVIDVPAP